MSERIIQKIEEQKNNKNIAKTEKTKSISNSGLSGRKSFGIVAFELHPLFWTVLCYQIFHSDFNRSPII